MKLILILFLFTTTVVSTSFGQTEKDKKEKEEKVEKEKKFVDDDDKVFRIGVHFTPQYYIFNKVSEQDVNTTYKTPFNIDFAFIFTAKFGKIIEAKTGIVYSSKNFKREEECAICGTEITEESSYKINYIEIPLIANLYFYNSRLDAYGIVGIRNSFLIKAKNYYKSDITKDNETVFNVKNDFKSYLFGVHAGVGINYNLTYSLSLTAEIIYTFNPLKFEPATGLNFQSLGLNVGINFKL